MAFLTPARHVKVGGGGNLFIGGNDANQAEAPQKSIGASLDDDRIAVKRRRN